jgi:hypothetical protein
MPRAASSIWSWLGRSIGSSLQDLIGFLSELHALGVDLMLHQQGLDTRTPAGKAMFQMMGVFAEFERAMIRERVKAGLERARAQGKTLGRPKSGNRCRDPIGAEEGRHRDPQDRDRPRRRHRYRAAHQGGDVGGRVNDRKQLRTPVTNRLRLPNNIGRVRGDPTTDWHSRAAIGGPIVLRDFLFDYLVGAQQNRLRHAVRWNNAALRLVAHDDHEKPVLERRAVCGSTRRWPNARPCSCAAPF